MALVVEPVVLFAEVPDFYAEVERRRVPGLMGRPIVVGGDPAKRGKVQSASTEARARGVRPGMPMAEALVACPAAVRLPTDMTRYREAWRELDVCLRRRVDALEPAGLGAVFFEADGLRASPEARAGELVTAVRGELGLPLRVGIAPSKPVARLVAAQIEGAGVRRVCAAGVPGFLAPLPVGVLPRVGRKAEARLAELGASTIGDVVALGAEVLERELGPRAAAILDLARGRDRAPVRAVRHPRSISREETLGSGEAGPEALSDCLGRLARSLDRALARHGLRAGRLALRVRFVDQTATTRSATLGEAVDEAERLHEHALALLDRAREAGSDVRGLGLTVAGLEAAGEPDPQLELFGDRSG